MVPANVPTPPKDPMEDLAHFPRLDSVSAAARELMVAKRQPFLFEPRKTIICCGETIGGTYFVTKGRLRAFIQDADGREKTLYHLEGGQCCILAINCTFSGVVYPAWVASGEEGAEGFFLPASAYKQLFETEPAVRDFTISVLTTWIYDLMTWVEGASLGSVAARLAHVLVRRSNSDGVITGTHQDLASDLGTAREVVSRHLKEFEAAGMIQRGRRQLRILDRGRLLAAS